MQRIPRWKLEEQERQRKHLDEERVKNERLMNTEENFPSLGKSQVSAKAGVWGVKRGADLAKEWAEHEENQKMEAEIRRLNKERDEVYTFSMPTFHNAGYYPEEENEEYEESVQKSEDNELVETGWVDVKKKIRKVTHTKKDSDSEESDSEKKKEETVWGGEEKELHETCWEGRY